MRSRKKIADGLMEVVKGRGADSTAYDRELQMAIFELLLDIRDLAIVDRIEYILQVYPYNHHRSEALELISDLESFVKYIPGLTIDIQNIKERRKRDAELKVKEILGWE